MHNNPKTLGDIVKYAREKSDFTVEELADKIGISERYLYKIENEGKKPSFDVLYKLVRTLAIPSDSIFYPEKNYNSLEIESILGMISIYDEYSWDVIKATAQALIKNN